jgi:hypothetical protein
MTYPKNFPRWFYDLPAHEQRSQVNRWRYHRQYQRRRLGNKWSAIWADEQVMRGTLLRMAAPTTTR